MAQSGVSIVILAAGQSTRMRSARSKVLHEVAGRAMLGHVLDAAKESGSGQIVVVLGPDMDAAAGFVKETCPDAGIAIQDEPKGTAHAVSAALGDVSPEAQALVVIFGDTPLIRPETIATLAEACGEGAGIAVLGFEAEDPSAYGRLVVEGGELKRIAEAKDASPEELDITLCNGGAMALSAAEAEDWIGKIGAGNANSEYYLTDAVEIARDQGARVTYVLCTEEEVLGVNSRADLAQAEDAMQERLRRRAMEGGVTLADPQTVYLSADTQIAADVTIGQNVVFGPGVTVENGVHIKPFSHLEGVHVRAGASVGPFARLRPGTDVGEGAKIGNFVEAKKAQIGTGAKVSHLSYIGDARIGAEANIGAGTITCNYDGFDKFFTDIGEGAFVGSNSALVAPVTIGDGAYIGSGSVITKDVDADALAVARGKQFEKTGWAAAFRDRKHNVKE